jgi:hypothetical protein
MKGAFTAVLALGASLAAAAPSHAAAGPWADATVQTGPRHERVQLAEYVKRKAVVPGARVVVPPRAVVRPGGAYIRPGGAYIRPGVVPRGAYVGRPGFVGRAAFVRPYRPWYRRPYFGTIIGGVALGTILTVAAVGVAPAVAPAPDLCWYWADPSLTSGYWDYCS